MDSPSRRQTFYESEETGTRPNSSSVLAAPESDENSLLPYDYLSLYSAVRVGEVDGRKAKVATKSKYFLPVLFSKLYLIAVLSALMQGTPFPFFILACFL